MNKMLSLSRRGFLKKTGCLTVAFSLPLSMSADLAFAEDALADAHGDLRSNPMLDAWIRINADGTVDLMIGKVELGQGIVTAFAQVAAEHLDVDIARLDILSGDTFYAPDQGTTAGSNSMPAAYGALRVVASEVRAVLLDLAADELGVPVDDLSVEDGTITGPNGAETTYWDLVEGETLHREATGQAPLKSPEDFRVIGQRVPRLDIPGMMNGETTFLQDLRPEGMVFGQVVRPPTYRARLANVETAAAEALPGVMAVIRNGSFLGVVAERQDQALNAANVLRQVAEWEVESNLPGNENMKEWLLSQEAIVSKKKDEPRSGGPEPAKWMEAEYYRPYHMHGSLGTSAAIATLGDDGVTTVQTHSQSVYATARAIAGMLGVEEDQVHLQHVQGSGCYGHNMADDAAADAALLAQAVPGRPVFMQYTREDEHRWEPYGSAMVLKTRAGLDEDGNVLDWEFDVYSTPHGMRPGGNPARLIPAQYLDPPFDEIGIPQQSGGPPNYNTARNAIADYAFPGHVVTDHYVPQIPLRVSSTRGLGAFANIFACESFMDELAHDAGVDPVEYRLRHMEDERARDCIMAAAERFGWDSFEGGRNRGRGFAFARYKNYAAMSAVALEVEVNPRNGRIRVIRAVTASDAGEIVNPDGLENQIEGGLIQMLSWTLKEEVRFDDTRVMSDDWASYPILTFNEVPPIENVLINRPGEPYLGAGETLVGQAGASVANAVFDAVGVRMRDLPLTPSRVQDALRG
ncbi:xanthine dehydrogenase family protein molybdopterin-binding subunit [Alkalilacustris brevis]|uniref:xanthine dehydrogenase family protein molybdopterin-binding subunit n=1 Tax=Alkalilacustris brevis TaxID=2026338 RepID=UPI000E0CCCBF|nr:molybdopterin cofactor-binding domain-containing protein [Alkalilacustris brevis]